MEELPVVGIGIKLVSLFLINEDYNTWKNYPFAIFIQPVCLFWSRMSNTWRKLAIRISIQLVGLINNFVSVTIWIFNVKFGAKTSWELLKTLMLHFSYFLGAHKEVIQRNASIKPELLGKINKHSNRINCKKAKM